MRFSVPFSPIRLPNLPTVQAPVAKRPTDAQSGVQLDSFSTTTALCTLAAYVVGAMPFGFWISKLRGIDIRDHGSGNIGATNVFRTLGPPVGVTVFVLDVLKGFLPVFVGRQIVKAAAEGMDNADQWVGGASVLLALAAIVGHNYTFFLGFKGGKGIATTAGAMLGFIPLVLAGSLTSWILVFYFSGYVALASIAAALVIPPLTIVHGLVQGTGINWPVVFFGLFASIMAIWRHRANIKRLRAGEEDRFDRKKRGVNKGQTETEP